MVDDLNREVELERRIGELERRLARAERGGSSGGGPETAFWALVHRIFPSDARHHMRSATREQLLAARTYLDRWIARLESKPAGENDVRHEKIQVE
jgi:hypothetical protein